MRWISQKAFEKLTCRSLHMSQFINLLTGDTSAAIGSSLESETAEVFPICFTDRVTGRNVTVVDTPGFDDSRQGVTDTDILTEIAKYMLIA